MDTIAIVYIGEHRLSDTTALNQKRLLDAISKKYVCRLYDFTHQNRTWSVSGLCSEQAQILDIHHALKVVEEPVVFKIRTDIWICPWEVDNIISMIDRVVQEKIDFVYIGPYVGLNYRSLKDVPEEFEIKRNHQPRFVNDVIVIFRKDWAQDVPALFDMIPEQIEYDLNRGWWMLPKIQSRCLHADIDVYTVRKPLESPSDFQVVEDWFDRAISNVQGKPRFRHNIFLRDRWRARYKVKINENNFL